MRCESLRVAISPSPIDPVAVHQHIKEADCGAQLVFLGTTRRTTGEKTTTSLRYQAYLPMAQTELEKLATRAVERWDLRRLLVQHRLGRVDVGEASVVVAAASPHRQAVMEAVPWLMDQIKLVVPIWKQETFADDSTSWIHPKQN